MSSAEFLDDLAGPLGWCYVVVAGLNVGAAWQAFRRQAWGKMAAWLALAAGFAFLGVRALYDLPVVLPEALKQAIDRLLGPVTVTLGSLAFLVGLYFARRFVVRPAVGWTGLNLALAFLGLSLTDSDFAAVVLRPDNVPIVAMVFLLGFFTWLGAAQAVANDDRISRGEPPVERDYQESTLVWPDLVYIELITMVIGTTVLFVWALVLRAPLEQPANPVVTPNPSKAPWYFLGLQEMLVFFDPALAGVILPTLIIIGLAAIPYLDVNPKGNGYYTIAQRKFSYVVFLFGFLQLWILLILVGTFLRGPNWSFFGLYEYRDPHKVVAQNNVKLSEYFWVFLLGRGVPQVPPGSGTLVQLGSILWREIAGIVALGLYFVGLPILLGRTALWDFRRRMGRGRYVLMTFLLLMMLALPLKMVLRWTVNLSHVVSIPEWFFGF
jgi:hypothetical protein